LLYWAWDQCRLARVGQNLTSSPGVLILVGSRPLPCRRRSRRRGPEGYSYYPPCREISAVPLQLLCYYCREGVRGGPRGGRWPMAGGRKAADGLPERQIGGAFGLGREKYTAGDGRSVGYKGGKWGFPFNVCTADACSGNCFLVVSRSAVGRNDFFVSMVKSK
jgi:hypothetical protein